jgi:integrase/recombinase XerD
MNRHTVVSMIERRIEAITHPPKRLSKGDRGLATYSNEIRRLLDSVESLTVRGKRDRAIIGLMLYASATPRVIAAMRVHDYYVQRDEYWLNLSGRTPTVVSSPLASLLREYLDAAQIGDARTTPLFQTGIGDKPIRPIAGAHIINMIWRRAAEAGLRAPYCPVHKVSRIRQQQAAV